MFVEYREAELKDFDEISDLVNRVFDKYIRPGYSKEGCTVFHKFVGPKEILERYNTGEFPLWVGNVDKKIVGTIGLRNWEHICLLFVDEKFHKLGIAKRLFEIARDAAIAKKQITEMTVHSSPYAIEVYKKLGFMALDEEHEQDGIRYIPMKLHL